MAMVSKIRTVGRAASVATAAAPYAQKLMHDTDLRSSIRQLVQSVNELYERLSGDGGLHRLASDDKVRHDVDRIIESLQSSARSVTRDTRRRSSRKALVFGVALGVAASGVAVAALYPRIRRSILSTAGDAREKFSATVDDARGKVAASADDVREKASATVDGARKTASDILDDAGEKLSHGADEAEEGMSKAADEVRRAV
jgi:vacuolar-type H+-ATPase subunit H